MTDWLNRVAKWRTILAGWQLGTRPKGDPEGDAVRDHREGSIIMRVEMNALSQLLVKKGIFTWEELRAEVQAEAKEYDKIMQIAFPGVRSTDEGLTIDTERAAPWMRNFRP